MKSKEQLEAIALGIVFAHINTRGGSLEGLILEALARVQDEALNSVLPDNEETQNIVMRWLHDTYLEAYDMYTSSFHRMNSRDLIEDLHANMSTKPQNIDTKEEPVDTKGMKPDFEDILESFSAYFDWDYDSEQTVVIRKSLQEVYNLGREAGIEESAVMAEKHIFEMPKLGTSVNLLIKNIRSLKGKE